MRLFLSCVSSEFKSYRLKLANHLGALKEGASRSRCRRTSSREDSPCWSNWPNTSATAISSSTSWATRAGPGRAGARAGALRSRAKPARSAARMVVHPVGIPPGPAVRKPDAGVPGPARCAAGPRLPVPQTDDDARLQQLTSRIISSGKHYSTVRQPHRCPRSLPRSRASTPTVKVNNLPLKTLGSLFKGGEEFLRAIHDALGRVDHCGHQRFAAITASATAATVHGLGGIGKTRAVVEYAHRDADEFTALLFVRADSRPPAAEPRRSVRARCVRPAGERRKQDRGAGRGRLAMAAAASRLVPDLRQRGFGGRRAGGGGPAVGVLACGPGAGHLAAERLVGRGETLALDVLAEPDAAAFLLERTEARGGKQPDDPDQARLLAVDLGQLAWRWNRPGPTS